MQIHKRASESWTSSHSIRLTDSSSSLEQQYNEADLDERKEEFTTQRDLYEAFYSLGYQAESEAHCMKYNSQFSLSARDYRTLTQAGR